MAVSQAEWYTVEQTKPDLPSGLQIFHAKVTALQFTYLFDFTWMQLFKY